MKKMLFTLMILTLLMPIGCAYAWGGSDRTDKLSNDQAGVFSPGYLNAAKQQAYSIVNQNNQPKSWWESLVEKIKDKVSNKVEEHANTKVKPEVKKKTSGSTLPAPNKDLTKTDSKIELSDEAKSIITQYELDKYYSTSITLSNGNTVVAWLNDNWYEENITHFSIFDQNGICIVNDEITNPTDYRLEDFSLSDAGNGYFAIAEQRRSHGGATTGEWIQTYVASNLYVFDENGNTAATELYGWLHRSSKLGEAVLVGGTDPGPTITTSGRYIAGVEFLDVGQLSLTFNDGTSSIFYVPDLYVPPASLPQETSDSTYKSALSSDYWRNISQSNVYGTYTTSPYESFSRLSGNSITQNAASGIFKNLLANKDALTGNMKIGEGGGLNIEFIIKLIENDLSTQALTIPLTDQERADQTAIALALANILKNPTEDQKAILDAVESLLADMKNLQEKAGINPELNKAENDLLQMVAAVLLAQGVPDLLKAGDIEGVKGIFKDLGQSKDKIMLDYTQSIKPYYNSIVKDLSTNLAMLQLKGILSKKITEEELKNLEPREIDRILESIRKSNDKSFELSYILQQDAKYRKEYMDPQNKALEEAMKNMMGSFTSRLNKILEDKN